MADKKNIIVIDDGTRELVLKNQFNATICKLHIRTSDLSLMDRYNDLMNDLGDVVKPLSEVCIKADGTAEFETEWAVIKKVEADLTARLGKLFDTVGSCDTQMTSAIPTDIEIVFKLFSIQSLTAIPALNPGAVRNNHLACLRSHNA